MIQLVIFTSAPFEAFAEAYLCFLISALAKKKEKCSLRIKDILVQDQIAMFAWLKSYFCLLHNFKTWFHNADHLLYHPLLSVFSFFILFLFSYIGLWEMEHRIIVNNKMNVKRSQEYQSMDSKYLTGQINSRILEVLLRWFCCLVFAPSQKF